MPSSRAVSSPSASTGIGTVVGARRRERVPRHLVAGILHHEAVAGVEQEARADVEPLLRAVHDNDLIDLAADASRSPQIALSAVRSRSAPQGSS